MLNRLYVPHETIYNQSHIFIFYFCCVFVPFFLSGPVLSVANGSKFFFIGTLVVCVGPRVVDTPDPKVPLHPTLVLQDTIAAWSVPATFAVDRWRYDFHAPLRAPPSKQSENAAAAALASHNLMELLSAQRRRSCVSVGHASCIGSGTLRIPFSRGTLSPAVAGCLPEMSGWCEQDHLPTHQDGTGACTLTPCFPSSTAFAMQRKRWLTLLFILMSVVSGWRYCNSRREINILYCYLQS